MKTPILLGLLSTCLPVFTGTAAIRSTWRLSPRRPPRTSRGMKPSGRSRTGSSPQGRTTTVTAPMATGRGPARNGSRYSWPRAVSTKEIAVYWWKDGQGIDLPKACRLLAWDGKAFAPVANARGLGVEPGKYNVTTFDAVTRRCGWSLMARASRPLASSSGR
ncbi:MAG: hypothetical protein U1F87_16025 [Kiritimatiellia bacterium]